jgi:hypothetical protein
MPHGKKSVIVCFTQLKIYVDTSTQTNLNSQINYTILPATNNYYVNEYNSGQRDVFKQTHSTRRWPGPLDGPARLLLLSRFALVYLSGAPSVPHSVLSSPACLACHPLHTCGVPQCRAPRWLTPVRSKTTRGDTDQLFVYCRVLQRVW